MFCIKCGKQAEAGNFCNKCFLEDHTLFEIKPFKIIYCECGSYIYSGWSNAKDLDDIIKSMVKINLKTNNELAEISVKYRIVGNNVFIEVEGKGKIKPCKVLKTEINKINVVIKKVNCKHCERLRGGYYESLIQIRGMKKQKIFDEIKKRIKKMKITNIEEIKDGYNIKFMSRKDAKIIMPSLRKKYSVNETYKLVGEKKGKKLYRCFYVVR